MITEAQMEFLESLETINTESLPAPERITLAVVLERVNRYGVGRAIVTRQEWAALNTLSVPGR